MRYLSSKGRPLIDPPFHRFFDFIDLKAGRFDILKSLMGEMGLNYMVLPVAGNRHFLISPSTSGLPFQNHKTVIVLAAHYDRAIGSPGANDNSVAVFLLLKTAQKLMSGNSNVVPWIIILTDKEELTSGQGIREQGSYSLAETLRQSGLGPAQVFIFDACGTGDTLIISTGTDFLLRNEKGAGAQHTRSTIQALRDHALGAARDLGLDKVLLLPTPFSDDAGFLRAGISAQTITVLPAAEASTFVSLVRSRPEISGALISRERAEETESRLIPATWRRLNSESDTHSRLSPEHFDMVARFAEQLCKR
ncbi:MAG: Zn-dependent exopeptidase M28 [Treponema sp.]|jgi:hypothetical protein|nr:Zn-dependent exopeptidase M28 [Treponema sp.]